ncbi:hypothetical protein V8C86DRAFT_3150505, partial [Haematococcus lacustris]
MQEPRARGSQEESKVPWDDSQDELFAELYAQAFAEVQGKTNGDKMGEVLAAYVNKHSASLGGRKMTYIGPPTPKLAARLCGSGTWRMQQQQTNNIKAITCCCFCCCC